MTRDVLYVERSGGRWEAWFYSDGQRHCYKFYDFSDVERMASRHGMELIVVE